ncbi:MAG: response regulator [Limnohabitans sp.]|jgi:CheY-like chemotaxis protein|nr:response regulator [Limnohabitans sp.]
MMKTNFNFLAVDDDSTILKIAEVACRPFDLHITFFQASNVHTAIDLSKRVAFDLILLDHDIGGVQGWELLDYLRPTLRLSPKVLVYSGHVDAVSRAAYTERAVHDILQKPLNISSLGFSLRKALQI